MKIELKYRKKPRVQGFTIHLFAATQSKNSFADDLAVQALAEDKGLSNYLKQARKSGADELHFSLGEQQHVIFLVKSKLKSADEREDLRVLGARAIQGLEKQKIREAQVVNHTGIAEASLLFAEGAALASYQYLELRSKASDQRHSLRTLYLTGSLIKTADIQELDAIVTAVCLTRDLVNRPLSHLTAMGFADAVKDAGQTFGFEVEVLGKKQVQSLKMGGLLAVNKGSQDPPSFSIATYRPDAAVNKKPLVLVGKGVVYDTGGYSLKPTANSMDFMKCDMAGAGTMLGVMVAIASLKLPIHVIALLPATDNRIGAEAIVPGDVITMYDGTTVEVKNTDAEGRLLLADALSYAKKYKPELVLDAATLTGASVRATGTYASSVMGSADKRSFDLLEKSGEACYERVVRFPLWREFRKELSSQVADLSNLGKGEGGQMSAGKFLEHFTSYPWIHIDIAGPSWNPSADAYRTAGGTGSGVRLIVEFLKRKYLK